MAKDFSKAFYGSKAWQQCRDAYIAHRKSVDGGMCENCHEVPGYIVHHKIELTPDNINDPNITLEFENLKYDCHICHNAEHGKGSKNKIPGMIEYELRPDGEIAILPPEKRAGRRSD